MKVVPRTAIDPMREQDIPLVQAIEREIFPTPWPRNAYHRELSQNRQASYIVLRQDEDLLGYGGLWKVGDEAHVTTVGVRRQDQGRGLGRAVFAALVLRSFALGARWISLEVRVSNERAMRLYEAFGFTCIGRRRGYYSDNGEDAVIMWSDSIHAPRFKTNLHRMLHDLEQDVDAVGGLDGEPPHDYPDRW